jgi:hypothetical protein
MDDSAPSRRPAGHPVPHRAEHGRQDRGGGPGRAHARRIPDDGSVTRPVHQLPRDGAPQDRDAPDRRRAGGNWRPSTNFALHGQQPGDMVAQRAAAGAGVDLRIRVGVDIGAWSGLHASPRSTMRAFGQRLHSGGARYCAGAVLSTRCTFCRQGGGAEGGRHRAAPRMQWSDVDVWDASAAPAFSPTARSPRRSAAHRQHRGRFRTRRPPLQSDCRSSEPTTTPPDRPCRRVEPAAGPRRR